MIRYQVRNSYHTKEGVLVIKSIKHFEEISTGIFEKVIGEFFRNPTDFASFTMGITEELHKVGRLLIQETLEEMDQMLRKSGKRKQDWVIEQHPTKQLVTSLGTVEYRKTFFTNKHTGETECLLDRILGLEKHERIAEDAHARMLEEAVQTSYRRGGEESCITQDKVTKQAVMKKIHELEFPKGWTAPEKKRIVDYLYIEADEDHIALQYRNKKGDLKHTGRGIKNNGAITKLIYVHEGIEPEAPKSRRHRLIRPHYFSRTAEGCSNADLWDEVYRYIDENYDLEKIKKIYLNSDGGGWIKAGMRRIGGVVHVLDRFHLEKHLTKLTSYMKDSADEARAELYKAICAGTKAQFAQLTWKLKDYLPETANRERFEESGNYILDNWTAAKLRLRKTEGKVGSSTEGHVSHELASRMSTQALGWSLLGADKMAQLRAYHLNGGDMLALVRYQKQEVPKAAGDEARACLSSYDILQNERNRHEAIGKYYDRMQHTMSLNTKKQQYFQKWIWEL